LGKLYYNLPRKSRFFKSFIFFCVSNGKYGGTLYLRIAASTGRWLGPLVIQTTASAPMLYARVDGIILAHEYTFHIERLKDLLK
jgi:hypothetical protein